MEREALAAGARIERRDGWNVAVAFDGAEGEREACRATVGFADRSALGKIEIQASAASWPRSGALPRRELELGRATRAGGAWWCPYTPERALVLCEPAATADLRGRLEERRRGGARPAWSTSRPRIAALAIAGPLARELFARFMRDRPAPAGHAGPGFRPGSRRAHARA